MKAVQEEGGGVARSVAHSRDGRSLEVSSVTLSIPLEMSSPAASGRTVSGTTASLTAPRGGSARSRLSSLSEHVWRDDRWRYGDTTQTSLAATILFRVTGASVRLFVGWRRVLLLWTCFMWLLVYLLFSVMWMLLFTALQTTPPQRCQAAADFLVLFAGLTHRISAICLRPRSSVQGVNVTLVVSVVACGTGTRLGRDGLGTTMFCEVPADLVSNNSGFAAPCSQYFQARYSCQVCTWAPGLQTKLWAK